MCEFTYTRLFYASPGKAEELSFINQIKREHLLMPAGAEIIRAGDPAPELYTADYCL